MKVLSFGASSTIAQDVQKIYAQRGYDLVLVGRNPNTLKQISSDLKVRGAKTADVYEKDLLEYKDADVFIKELWNKYSGFDLVLVSHGLLGNQREDEKTSASTLQIIESNFNSQVAYLTPIANLMESQGRGRIAVISSVAGERGKQSNYIYCAAKAGMIAFLSGLRNRLFVSQVSVTDFRLGFVDTAMTTQYKKGLLWAKSPAVAKSMVSAIDKGKDVVYLPWFWWGIMFIIKSIPEFVFKRLKM